MNTNFTLLDIEILKNLEGWRKGRYTAEIAREVHASWPKVASRLDYLESKGLVNKEQKDGTKRYKWILSNDL